jgi:hypothetical protein
MIDRINKIREKLKNRYIKAAIFFGFYLFFFAFIFILLSFNSGTNNAANKNDTVKDKWEILNNNYQYLYQINIQDGKNPIEIALQGKNYNHKNLYTKYVDKEETNEVYTFYDDIYIKENNEWITPTDFIKIYTNFDDKLIDLSNIKEMTIKDNLVNKVTNFDDSIDETYLYHPETGDDINIDITSKDNIISKITIKLVNVDITLQYKNVNEIKDFVIETKDK